MKLTLTRKNFSSDSTIGELAINGKFECYTLEDVVRPNGVKIYGETAIPAGNYKVDITFSPRFKTMLPLLIDVPNFIGIRIHPGNSAGDTDGCILVGQTRSTDFIGNSRAAFNALFAQLQAAKAAGEDIAITVG